MSEIPEPRRSWPWAGVCTLLAAILLCGGVGSWISRAIRQREAVAALTRSGEINMVFYNYELDKEFEWIDHKPPGPAWLHELLGIDYLATVRKVELYETSDDHVRPLNDLPGLRALHVGGEITDMGVEQLKGLAGLEELHLFQIDVTDKGLAVLPSLTSLRSINIVECYHITDAGLAHVSEAVGLRTFALIGSEEVTNVGLAKLSRLTNLETLDLDFSGKATDAVLKQLQSLPKLRHLELAYGDDDAGTGLKFLGGLRSLEELDFYGSDGLTDAAFSQLPTLRGVNDLSLVYWRRLTDEGLKNLAKLPNLQNLFISNLPELHDAGIANLEHLSKLAELTIYGGVSGLTDASLESIGRIGSLRKLRLFGCAKLTDVGLPRLAGLRDLEELRIEVANLDQVSPSALASLRRSLPKCQIDYRQLQTGTTHF